MAEWLPDSLLHEIFSRLPGKTLCRSRSVCRRWHDLISEQILVTAQAQRSTRNVLGLFNITVNPSGGKLTYIPLDCNIHEVPDTSLGLPLDHAGSLSPKASCNGIIFCQFGVQPNKHCFIVGNPTVKAFKQLPFLSTPEDTTTFGLAFDPTTSTTSYRIVACMKSDQGGPNASYMFSIYSSEVDNWTTSKETFPCTHEKLFNSIGSIYSNGALHWLRKGEDIVAFHVGEERAYRIQLPQGLKVLSIAGYPSVWLGTVVGRMNLVKFNEGRILVWELADYNSGRWQMKHRIKTRLVQSYVKIVPILFDGEVFAFLIWIEGMIECKIIAYRMHGRRWDIIGGLEGCMDRCRYFFPYISNMVRLDFFTLHTKF